MRCPSDVQKRFFARLPETTRASFGPQVTNPQLIIACQRNDATVRKDRELHAVD